MLVYLLATTSIGFHLPTSTHRPTVLPPANLRHGRSPLAQLSPAEAAKAAWLANNPAAWEAPSPAVHAVQPPTSYGAQMASDNPWLTGGAPILTLEAADEMTNVALREATAMGINPVSVVVLDASGRTLVSKTMIGAARLSPDFAHAKASACVGLHCSSRELRDKYVNDDGIGPKMPQVVAMGTAAAAAGKAIAPFPGGVLCRDAMGNVICAIGVSGAASDEDEHCAILGAQAVGLVTEPAASRLL